MKGSGIETRSRTSCKQNEPQADSGLVQWNLLLLRHPRAGCLLRIAPPETERPAERAEQRTGGAVALESSGGKKARREADNAPRNKSADRVLREKASRLRSSASESPARNAKKDEKRYRNKERIAR